MSQQIIWTSLPNGVITKVVGDPMDDQPDQTRTFLRLSVFVAPRLRTDDGSDSFVRSFPDFHDWPLTLSQYAFKVHFKTTDPFPVAPVQQMDSGVWKSLFPLATKVTSHVFNGHENSVVHSTPASALESYILGKYGAQLTSSPTEYPDLTTIASALDLLMVADEGEREVLKGNLQDARTPPAGWTSGGAIPPNAYVEPQEQLVLAGDFLGKDGFAVGKNDPPPFDPPPEPEDPDLDFHRLVTAVGQYPTLMRKLGLVLDFEIDVTDPDDLPVADDTEVWIEALRTGDDIPERGPSTRCVVGRAEFRALARREDNRSNGYLIVGPDWGYRPITLDVDGAALKLVEFAKLLGSTDDSDAPDKPDSLALPSLRSGGIALTRQNNAGILADALAKQLELNGKIESGQPVVFEAEDLTRGLRIDVHETVTNRWHSLMQRIGRYIVGAKTRAVPDSVDDAGEGYISTAPTRDFEDTPDHLYLPESLFVWDGWSLVVPRPGKVIGIDEAVEDAGEETAKDLDVQAQFGPAPASLPVLRYGREYRFRARPVDLAGNGPEFDATYDPAESPSSLPVTYGRFEPISSPTVLLVDPRGEGESVERVVLYNDNRSPNVPSTPAPNARHIAPPKVSVTMAELHGMFDRVGDDGRVGPNPDVYAALVERDRGGFYRNFDDPTLGPDLIDHPDAQRDDNDYDGTFYYPTRNLVMNYLPDPLANGAAFRFLPGPDGEPMDASVLVSYAFDAQDAWVRRVPFRLVLQGGPPGVDVDQAARVLNVSLPPAAVITARVSSYPARTAPLDHLGFWPSIDGNDGLFSEIVQGRHWMITPYREITLVHAVRVPLARPELTVLNFDGAKAPPSGGPDRQKGDTFVWLNGTVTYDRKSTARIDVHAAWREFIDGGPGTPPPTTRPTSQVAFSISGDRGTTFAPEPQTFTFVQDRHELGDTKHRFITYTAEASTRFGEYFVEHKQCSVDAGSGPIVLSDAGLAPGWVSVKSLDGQIVLTEGTDYTVDLGDPEADPPRPGTITFVNQVGTFDVSFLAKPISTTSAQPYREHILSTARPAPPKIHSIVPSFAWSNPPSIDPRVRNSNRKGGGLRIYLERPWYSSGADERLGVLVFPSDLNADTFLEPDEVELNKPFTTMWGMDPIFKSPQLPTQIPTKDTIVSDDDASKVLAVPEAGDSELVRYVAAHRVQYDPELDLYFADVEFDTGLAYTPFVRLALVRFQPFSLDGCHVSPPVVADFVQLAPDRFLSVTPGSAGDRRKVKLSGPSYTAVAAYDGAVKADLGAAEVIVETRDQAAAPGDLGWVQSGAATQLTAVRTLLGVQWSGEVQVPAGPARLVVEQFEVLPIENETPARSACDTEPPPPRPARLATTRRRIVYSDIVEL